MVFKNGQFMLRTKFDYKKAYFINRLINFIQVKINTFAHRIFLKNHTLIVGARSKFYLNNVAIGNNVKIGNDVLFTSESENGFIEIADNVTIDDKCLIDCSGGITIGADTHLSIGVKIYTHDHGLNPKSKPKCNQLEIEEMVWLCEDVTLLHNVQKVSKNAVIGYGALVTKKINTQDVIYLSKNEIVKMNKSAK